MLYRDHKPASRGEAKGGCCGTNPAALARKWYGASTHCGDRLRSVLCSRVGRASLPAETRIAANDGYRSKLGGRARIFRCGRYRFEAFATATSAALARAKPRCAEF